MARGSSAEKWVGDDRYYLSLKTKSDFEAAEKMNELRTEDKKYFLENKDGYFLIWSRPNTRSVHWHGH